MSPLKKKLQFRVVSLRKANTNKCKNKTCALLVKLKITLSPRNEKKKKSSALKSLHCPGSCRFACELFHGRWKEVKIWGRCRRNRIYTRSHAGICQVIWAPLLNKVHFAWFWEGKHQEIFKSQLLPINFDQQKFYFNLWDSSPVWNNLRL